METPSSQPPNGNDQPLPTPHAPVSTAQPFTSQYRLPNGISNFKELINRGYHYIERTQYIELLEATGLNYVYFLRPRRFGKSLFISTLQHYYGCEHADDFNELFGPLYIGRHVTPYANQFLVLRFDFSRIDTESKESTYQSFLSNVVQGIQQFLHTYQHILEPKALDFTANSPRDAMQQLLTRAFGSKIKGFWL